MIQKLTDLEQLSVEFFVQHSVPSQSYETSANKAYPYLPKYHTEGSLTYPTPL